MKTKILLIFAGLLAFCIARTQNQEVTWGYGDALPINEMLQKICTQGNDTVYVVSQNGMLARSADRAESWDIQYPVSTQLNDIVFLNHQIGFAVGNGGVILQTTDSGDTWVQILSGTAQNINAIAIASMDNIWAVGDNGVVLHTTDIGQTWTAENLITDNSCLYDVKFNGNTGYIVGDNGTILKTLNNGIDWITQAAPIARPIHSICFAGDTTYALMSEGVYTGLVIFSEYNGQWQVYNHGFLSGNAGSIYFIDENTGFVSGYAWLTGEGWLLKIFKTTDGGANMERRKYNLSKSILL